MTKVIVYHSYYGCETGCCGHTVEIGNESRFDFSHPYSAYGLTGEAREKELREFAEELVRDAFGEEHVADLAWDECEIRDD